MQGASSAHGGSDGDAIKSLHLVTSDWSVAGARCSRTIKFEQ